MKRKNFKSIIFMVTVGLALFMPSIIYAQGIQLKQTNQEWRKQKQEQIRAERLKKKRLKKEIGPLYKEALSNYKQDKLDLAKENFDKILSLEPNQATARHYLEKKIPARIKQLQLAQKRTEEKRRLKQETEKKVELEAKAKEISLEVEDLEKTRVDLSKSEQMEAQLRDLSQKIELFNRENISLKEENEGLKEKAKLSNKLQREKEDLEKKNQGFIKEIASLKGINSGLEAGLKNLKNLNAQLETKAKELYIKAQDAEQMKKDFAGLKMAVESLNKERIGLKEENERLRNEIASLQETLKNERAKLYQELGTAYTQLKLFDLAIKTYKNSLSFNPRNAQVHYNLGLVYKHSKNYTKEAIYHLKKYIQLNPRAENRKEVDYLIKMLAAD